jgi:hypothetical protein
VEISPNLAELIHSLKYHCTYTGCDYIDEKGPSLFAHELECEHKIEEEESKCYLCEETDPEEVHYCSVKGRGIPDLN